ncbi:nucleoside triphosphate pyrophosphohydrolase family protein [Hutsoniella sourekii]|uniref:hypothetical protein n=1 Tax=Hutsoniella sourekii TaxID=87650 RepID=UPI000489C93B|nr:hypothetical protein [Hutsoniella sourekii]
MNIDYIELVKLWAMDKGLHQSDSKAQTLRAFEEFGEAFEAIFFGGKLSDIQDGIGDSFVTLIVLCQQYTKEFYPFWEDMQSTEDAMALLRYPVKVGRLSSFITKGKGDFDDLIGWFTNFLYDLCLDNNLEPEECLQAAYNEIKDRTGVTGDGGFIKDEDLVADDCQACKI